MRRTLLYVLVLVLTGSLLAAPLSAQDGDGDQSGGWTGDTTTDTEVVRLAGDGRAATAAAIALAGDTSTDTATDTPTDTVLIARDDAFPDALVGSVLAGALDAPILLASGSGVPAVTVEAIEQLGASTAIILGGVAALGPQVEADLAAAGLAVERLAGATRLETAQAVVQAADSASDTVPGLVGGDLIGLVASAADFPDALVGGAAAAGAGLPLLLVTPDGVPTETASLIQSLDLDGVVVLGGTAAVPEAVVIELENLGVDVSRLAGDTRQATAAAVADWAVDTLEWRPTGLVLARPDDFPDALAAAPFAGGIEAPILLAGTEDASEVAGSVSGCTVSTIYVAGGELAVSEADAEAVASSAGSSDACGMDVRAFPQQAVVPVGADYTVTADLLNRDRPAFAQDADLQATFTVTADTFSVGVATPTIGQATVPMSAAGTAAATFTSNSPGLVVVEVCGSGSDGVEVCDTTAVRFTARYAADIEGQIGYVDIIDGRVCVAAVPASIASVTFVGPDREYLIDGSIGCADAAGLTSADVDANPERYGFLLGTTPAGPVVPIGNDYREWSPTEAPPLLESDATVSGVDLITSLPETNGSTALNFMTAGGREIMVANGQYGLKLYDMADPTAPELLDEFIMPDFWQNEDVDLDDDRDIVFLSRDPRAFDGTTDDGVAGVYIFDVSDPTDIVRIGFHELPAGHTATCVRTDEAACDFLWSGGPATGLHQPDTWEGRPVFVTDVRDPAKPFTYPEPLLTQQNDGVTDYAHDVQVDSDDIAWVSSRGGVYGFHTMGEHTDPLTGEIRQATPTNPIPVAGGGLSDADAPSRFMHNSYRPVGDTADEGADLEAGGTTRGSCSTSPRRRSPPPARVMGAC